MKPSFQNLPTVKCCFSLIAKHANNYTRQVRDTRRKQACSTAISVVKVALEGRNAPWDGLTFFWILLVDIGIHASSFVVSFPLPSCYFYSFLVFFKARATKLRSNVSCIYELLKEVLGVHVFLQHRLMLGEKVLSWRSLPSQAKMANQKTFKEATIIAIILIIFLALNLIAEWRLNALLAGARTEKQCCLHIKRRLFHKKVFGGFPLELFFSLPRTNWRFSSNLKQRKKAKWGPAAAAAAAASSPETSLLNERTGLPFSIFDEDAGSQRLTVIPAKTAQPWVDPLSSIPCPTSTYLNCLEDRNFLAHLPRYTNNLLRVLANLSPKKS